MLGLLSPIAFEEQHHHEAGEEQVFLRPREVTEPVEPEAALEDRAFLLHPQDRLATQVHEVGGVEEEASEGVGEREGLGQAIEDLDEGVLLVDHTDGLPVRVRDLVGALPQGAHAPLPDGAQRLSLGAAHGVARAEVHHPVRPYAEEQPLLVLVLVDADVLLEPELLLPEVGDLTARGVGHAHPRADGRDLEAHFQRVVQHGLCPPWQSGPSPRYYAAGPRTFPYANGDPGWAGVSVLSSLSGLDEVRDEGVTIVVALAHPVGGVRHVHEGHDGGDCHHRDEEEADQDQGQEARERPARAEQHEPRNLVAGRLQRVEGDRRVLVPVDQPDHRGRHRPQEPGEQVQEHGQVRDGRPRPLLLGGRDDRAAIFDAVPRSLFGAVLRVSLDPLFGTFLGDILLGDLVGYPVVLFLRLHCRLLSAVYVLRQEVKPGPSPRHRTADRMWVVLRDQSRGVLRSWPWSTRRITERTPGRAGEPICSSPWGWRSRSSSSTRPSSRWWRRRCAPGRASP